MEMSAKGDLKQYLKARANRSSSDLSYPPSFAISFIDQIIEGVNAVHSLDVSNLALLVDWHDPLNANSAVNVSKIA